MVEMLNKDIDSAENKIQQIEAMRDYSDEECNIKEENTCKIEQEETDNGSLSKKELEMLLLERTEALEECLETKDKMKL